MSRHVIMRTLHARLVMLATVLLVALAVSQTASPALAAATIATVLLVAAVTVAATTVSRAKTLTVGTRARAHKEALSEMAEPRHPSTAGLPLTRAPSNGASAA